MLRGDSIFFDLCETELRLSNFPNPAEFPGWFMLSSAGISI